LVIVGCQGHVEQEQSDPEWSGITLKWKGVDNKSGGTTLASAHVLCLDLLLYVWLYHDLAKQLSHYLYFFSFLFLFFYLGLTTQKEVWESIMLQVSHSHGHMTGSHSIISHDVT